jgi:hypothetical protein
MLPGRRDVRQPDPEKRRESCPAGSARPLFPPNVQALETQWKYRVLSVIRSPEKDYKRGITKLPPTVRVLNYAGAED